MSTMVRELVALATLAFPAPVPAVTGALPGKPVAVVAKGAPIVAGSVHEVAATGTGAARVPLYVARGRHGELCLGTSGIFRCLGRPDGEPMYAFTVFAGHTHTPDLGAVVGFAEPGTRVTLELQSAIGTQITLPTTSVPGLPLRVFVSRVYRRNGNLPDLLRVFDRHGNELAEPSDLGFLFTPPCMDPNTCGPSWRVGGDVSTDSAGQQALNDRTALNERAKAVAFADPLLRKLLRGRSYSVSSQGPWVTDSGRRLIGAVLSFHLAKHASFTEDWPMTGCDPKAAYSASVVHLSVSNVSELDVWVDTHSGRVVGVDPTSNGLDDPEPDVDQPGARVVVKPHPAGFADKGSCKSGD